MTNDSDDNFDLNEPAAGTHHPSGWAIETVQLVPSGKAPKKYGPSTYRFSAALTLPVILPRRGWELVKKTKNYAYLRPPEGSDGPPFQIEIAVPSPAEFLEIAARSYARGQSWIGQLGEWPAFYQHERNMDMREMWRNPASGEMESRLHANPPQSNFAIGEYGIWRMSATSEEGRFSLGMSYPITDMEQGHAPQSAKEHALFEGTPTSVKLTKYERNPAARQRCIEHFGPTCLACGLNYEQKYGALAAGLIHVHHIVPISTKGQVHNVDPLRDLVPLCATCHHVVHSKDPPMSIEEVKQAIETARR